ncbi:hypothetical protein [Embleya hyalina]|uniref:Uncharacterized protein n=1 Tax=Embleya hyalina TaxID=516124 RepID=A0A401YX41_9ACTN|nr:hypothetical protein [Embleya hyalina]GCD99141.1 hypothetical protein EHYA_06854 [Embleya hyalina]
MTTAQNIQWIALPAGLSPDGTQARLSVFVAPRLMSDGPGTLAAFPDFRDWPARVAGATFALALGDESGVLDGGAAVVPLTRTGQPSDSALWQLFFPEGTPVEAFEFDDHRQNTMVSYPARDLADTTRQSFASTAAESPDSMPPSQAMSTLAGFAAATDMQGTMQGMRENIVTQLAAADELVANRSGELVRPQLSPQEAFLAFHEPQPQVAGLVADGGPHIAPPPEVPRVDFHQLLSSLGDHPKLLRRLGLVLDFVLPVDKLPGASGERTIVLVPTWEPLLGRDASHDHPAATRYALAPGQGFCAAADGNDAFGPPARGLLALPEDEYTIEQADIDGVTLKLMTAAVATATDGDAEAAPPTVRTKGLSLVLGDRTRHLHENFQRAADRQDALADEDTTVVLSAEDLVRGHRLDIFDETRQKWFSLHEREIAYDRAGSPGDHLDTASDEGFFQLSLATPVTAPGAAQRVHVHEHLVTWDGWALSAPHPGMAVAKGDSPERISNTAATTMPLEIETRARPGSLPRLRFGNSYRIRVRTVDLAGNGPTAAEADGLLDQDVLVLPAAGGPVFRRFEAIPPPLLLPRVAFTEGTSAHRLVIRSTAELTPAQYAETFNASPPVSGGTHAPYREVDERHVVAPKTSLQCAERHGKLDEAIGSGDADARERVYTIASRESGSLDDASRPGTASVTYPSATPDTAEGHYVLYTGETVELPYLPDPLAEGVVFHELPGVPAGQGFTLPWDASAWHAPKSILLRIREGSGPPVFDTSTRVLTVLLPKATVATVRVCSRVKVNEKTMGMLKWCRDALQPDQFESVMAAARANRHWMLTPWYDVTLVHAVQRPLVAPLLTLDDGTDRLLGATGEHLVGSLELSAASTERIDMIASWSENVDDLTMPSPSVLDVTTPVFRLPLAAAVPLDPVASEAPPSTLDGDTLTFNTVVAEELASAVEPGRPPATPVPAKCEFGDTKRRDVTFTPVATSRFGDCFPPEFTQDTERELLSVHGGPVEHTVLSSAKPAAPRVLGSFLTLGFETSGSLPNELVRRRRGGGFRVYLSRPWFSSGDGELLAVVLGVEGDEQPPQAHPFITLMGRDPIRSAAPVFLPSASNFPGATITLDLALPEVFDGFTVTAAGFEPIFDRPSGRWYCDIDVDTGGAYFPFLRPALARLQPRSMETCHLSPIVLADTLRLLPERTLTLSGTDSLNVQLTGPAYHDDNGPPSVTAAIEQRDPDVPDPVLGWFELGETVTDLFADDDTSLFPTYSAEVPLPDPRPDQPCRLMITEMAVMRSDFAVDEFGPTVGNLVYADAVEL